MDDEDKSKVSTTEVKVAATIPAPVPAVQQHQGSISLEAEPLSKRAKMVPRHDCIRGQNGAFISSCCTGGC